MTPPTLINLCPLWDLLEDHAQICLANDEWCSIENAELFLMCPKYKLLVELLGVKE